MSVSQKKNRSVRGEKDMGRFAAEYAAGLTLYGGGACVVALTGELGSGKTTFARGVLRAFGVEEPVTSPTFVIEKVYKPPRGPFKRIIHADAYRLENGGELERMGWGELLKDKETLILIEWPERVPSAVPKDARRLTFSYGDGSERLVLYE